MCFCPFWACDRNRITSSGLPKAVELNMITTRLISKFPVPALPYVDWGPIRGEQLVLFLFLACICMMLFSASGELRSKRRIKNFTLFANHNLCKTARSAGGLLWFPFAFSVGTVGWHCGWWWFGRFGVIGWRWPTIDQGISMFGRSRAD